MAFDGTEGGQISLQEGAQLTRNYRIANPNNRNGHFMGKDILNNILGQSGCVGIRVYHGLNASGERELVFVGVDANENDIITGVIADQSVPCPSFCSSPNSLNS